MDTHANHFDNLSTANQQWHPNASQRTWEASRRSGWPAPPALRKGAGCFQPAPAPPSTSTPGGSHCKGSPWSLHFLPCEPASSRTGARASAQRPIWPGCLCLASHPNDNRNEVPTRFWKLGLRGKGNPPDMSCIRGDGSGNCDYREAKKSAVLASHLQILLSCQLWAVSGRRCVSIPASATRPRDGDSHLRRVRPQGCTREVDLTRCSPGLSNAIHWHLRRQEGGMPVFKRSADRGFIPQIGNEPHCVPGTVLGELLTSPRLCGV